MIRLLERRPERRTLLGAPTACWPCHADEHRGQLGTDCARCHVDAQWRPAPRFSHAKTSYPLTGRHGMVACEKCHPRRPAPAPEAGASQVAVVGAASAVHYKGLRFGACGDCHRDPHAGKFGPACASCHVTEGWKRLVGAAGEKAFHEKTAYPLRGGHVDAPCKSCHGPFPGEKQRMKGIPFAACTDCHADAHDGRIAAAKGDPRTCDRCHGVEAWTPVRYEAEDHARGRYPLEGGHPAVASAPRHPKDPAAAARFPAVVRGRLEARDRPVRIASQRFRVEKSEDCRTCHRDPHAGQFEARLAGRGCGACHVVASWRQERFEPFPWPRGSRREARRVEAMALHQGSLLVATSQALVTWDRQGEPKTRKHGPDQEEGYDDLNALLSVDDRLYQGWRTHFEGGVGPAVEAPLHAERLRELFRRLDDARFDLDLRLRPIERVEQ